MSKKIVEKIEEMMDHYTPYRQITDSNESKAIRGALNELLEFIDNLK